MSKSITFGKYSGSTVLEVAIADPSYATWAACNLKSADWRNAFSEAIVAARSATVEEIASAHESPDSPHYAKVLAMVKADKEKEDAQKTEIDSCLARFAAAANVGSDKFGKVVLNFIERMVSPAAIDPQKFSRPEIYQAVISAMSAVEEIQRKHFLQI